MTGPTPDGGRMEDRWALDDIGVLAGIGRDAHPAEVVRAVRTARERLIEALDLGDRGGGGEWTWDDIVAYINKARGTARMTLAMVRRHTTELADAVGHPDPDNATWPEALRAALAARAPQPAAVRPPADGEDDAEVWIPPVDDCMDTAHEPACPHCGSRVYHLRTRRCGECGRRPDVAQPAEPRSEVVTLCGSMRFLSQMLRVAAQETAAGRIVLAPFSVVPREDQHGQHKAMLDELHRRKIDLSSRIIVVSDGTGYHGTSTAGEIAYAREQGKQVDFQWVADQPTPPAPADPHLAHYLSLLTPDLAGLRDTLVEGRGNAALLSAVEQEIARRAAAPVSDLAPQPAEPEPTVSEVQAVLRRAGLRLEVEVQPVDATCRTCAGPIRSTPSGRWRHLTAEHGAGDWDHDAAPAPDLAPQSAEPDVVRSAGALRRTGGNVDRWDGRRWVPTVIVAGSTRQGPWTEDEAPRHAAPAADLNADLDDAPDCPADDPDCEGAVQLDPDTACHDACEPAAARPAGTAPVRLYCERHGVHEVDHLQAAQITAALCAEVADLRTDPSDFGNDDFPCPLDVLAGARTGEGYDEYVEARLVGAGIARMDPDDGLVLAVAAPAPDAAPDLLAIVADVERRFPGLHEPDELSDWSRGVVWMLDRLRNIAAAHGIEEGRRG